MRTMIVLAWTMIGLLLSGDARALAQQDSATRPGKQWLATTDPVSGLPISIKGWTGPDGRVQFDPLDYPQFVAKPKIEPKAQAPTAKATYPKTGVVFEKMPEVKAGTAWHGGNAVQVFEGTENGKPPEVYLTIIGTATERKTVRAELESSADFQALRSTMGDKLAIHEYPPDAVMVINIGLAAGGKPDVVIQDASGGDRGRWRNNPGAGAVVERIRRINPEYDKTPRKPTGADDTNLKVGALAGAFLVGLAVIGASKQRGQRWKSRS